MSGEVDAEAPQTTASQEIEFSPNIPATISNFEGLSNLDNSANPAIGGLVLPPDTVGDVGPTQYVQATNLLFRVFSKAGAPLTPTRPISALFTTMGGRCATNDDGDPIVLYDSFADRWIITQFVVSGAAPLGQCFAISQTGDATGAYFTYDFVYPNNKFNDYPKFGVWPDGYYVSFNQFNLAGTAFLGVGVFAYDRAKVLAGDPTASFIYFDLETSHPNARGMLPSDADGLNPPPAGAPNVFAYFNANEFAGDLGDSLRLFNFHADFAVPANSTFTERPESPVAVAPFNPLNPAGLDDIEQPPPATATSALDSIQDRLMNRLQYRNYGAHQALTVNHTVNVGTGATLATHQAGVRYYELRNTAGTYTVREQGTHAPDTDNRWMGSAAMDHQGNLAVGFSISSTATFPGIRYAGRLAGDPLGSLAQGEATMIAGSGVQTNTGSRWGDYSALNVDPTDDCTFFYTQEYYATTDATPGDFPFGVPWQTRVGSFKVNPTCTAPAQGSLVVNVTNCQTGTPIQGAYVTINGNLYDATAANGQSSPQLPPGAYTVTVTAPDFSTSTTNNVVITNGNTTTINVCITGIPDIDPAGATITAESCSPADNALSPGETVTVEFGLKNSGTAPTNNLTATLQATGGVTSPSGPQNYGSIPPDNTTVVSRPFTFTVDPSVPCGGTVTATLQLNDSVLGDLGTVTFTLQVGAVGGSVVNTYSSGNISVPIPDVSTVEVPINVPDNGVVNDINVRVRLNHTFDGDLDISLVHPDGTVILLSNNRGGSGDNFGTGANDCSGTPTVFDDEAATAIAAGVAPFAGSFRPDTALSGMDGKTTQGTWKLRVADTANLDTGTIGCVTLEINRGQFVCCGVAGTPNIVAGDATLINESCPPDNGAIDPGERVTVSLRLTNNGTGATTDLVATLVQGGGVTAPSDPQSYGALQPIPPNNTATRDFSFTAAGVCGGQITATWNLNDGPNNLGTVTKTFTLGAQVNSVQTFANPAPITIPATGTGAATGAPAAPYPSTINVAGITNPVTKVTVTLKSLNHTFPGDIDVLLVGPGGQRLLLMSDVGAGTDAVNVNLTFDDTAAGPIGATVVSGTFRPTNIGGGDLFPAPAPAGPYNDPQLLSVFNGVNPNGTWSLYVVDDANLDSGNINLGWELNITTSAIVCTTPCGIVRLVVEVESFTRVNATTVKATYRIRNNGTVLADDVTLTQALLGASSGGPLPTFIGDIPPNNVSPPFDVFFTNSTPGASTTLKLNGTYVGGAFNSTRRVTIP